MSTICTSSQRVRGGLKSRDCLRCARIQDDPDRSLHVGDYLSSPQFSRILAPSWSVLSASGRELISSVVVFAQIRVAFTKMAFPGMSAPGLGGAAGLDEQKLKEQQMIKFVRAWPIPEQTSSGNSQEPRCNKPWSHAQQRPPCRVSWVLVWVVSSVSSCPV